MTTRLRPSFHLPDPQFSTAKKRNYLRLIVLMALQFVVFSAYTYITYGNVKLAGLIIWALIIVLVNFSVVFLYRVAPFFFGEICGRAANQGPSATQPPRRPNLSPISAFRENGVVSNSRG